MKFILVFSATLAAAILLALFYGAGGIDAQKITQQSNPTVIEGKGAGLEFVQRVDLYLPSNLVSGELKSYYFDDGSFFKDSPPGIIIFNAKTNKHYFFDKQIGDVFEIDKEVGDLPNELRKISDDEPCASGDQKWKCELWVQEMTDPILQTFFQEETLIDLADVLGELPGYEQIKRELVRLFGEESTEAKGLPFKGAVRLNDVLAAEYDMISIQRFTNKALPPLPKGKKVSLCKFFPVYSCVAQ